MEIFQNLDLLSVATAAAAIGILGFVIFLSNRGSATNRIFFTFAIASILWSAFNYGYYEATEATLALWLLRIHAFFAVWYSFFLFELFYVFPREKAQFPRWHNFVLVPIVSAISLLSLTKYTFTAITAFSPLGRIEDVGNGFGVFLFGGVIIFLVIAAFTSLIRKTLRAQDREERRAFGLVLTGGTVTFILHIIFNLIFPAALDNPRYIPFGAVFIFPLIVFTYYAVRRHHLLNIKVLTTEIMTFILAMVTFLEIVFAADLPTVLFRSGVFILVMSFSVILIRSVRREVEQREKLQVLTTELAEKNEKLKELDKLKDEFLSFASHDLKSPVTKMKQWASLIYDKTYNTPPQIEETAFKIKNTADRAIRLVDEFLNIRKLEEGKIEYVFEDKDIVAFAKGVVSDFELIAKQKNLTLTYNGPTNPILCTIDTTKIRQVIENLIDNSIKYTEAGSIAVTVTEEQKSVLISIKDTGGGMEKEILNDLFTQFKREAGVAKKIQGTGLGLYIAKQFVIGHKGEVWAESDGRGKGSQFYVRLPKK